MRGEGRVVGSEVGGDAEHVFFFELLTVMECCLVVRLSRQPVVILVFCSSFCTDGSTQPCSDAGRHRCSLKRANPAVTASQTRTGQATASGM